MSLVATRPKVVVKRRHFPLHLTIDQVERDMRMLLRNRTRTRTLYNRRHDPEKNRTRWMKRRINVEIKDLEQRNLKHQRRILLALELLRGPGISERFAHMDDECITCGQLLPGKAS